MADFDLVVAGGTVVAAGGRAPWDVAVREGRIAALLPHGTAGAAARTVDASGLLVLPGFVDTHVHLMDPGDPSREDFLTGTTAAARAGVTTVVEHTHAWPVTGVARLREKQAHLSGRSWVDYGLGAHAWPGHQDEIPSLWEAGISYLKVFTCATHGVPAFTYGLLEDLFRLTAAVGATCLVHAEDEDVTARAEASLRAAGRSDPGTLPAWRSREAEEVAVAGVGTLSRMTGAPVVVAHASTAAIAERVAAYRAAGAPIAAETCPQYLYLWEEEVLAHGPFRKFTPPARIRSDHDRQRMWDTFNSGGFHHLSTDHAPSTRAQKSAGSMWDAPFGLPGLDTTSAVMIDAALRGLTSLERVVEAYATAPARLYRLGGKGEIRVGADADLVLIDPAAVRVLSDESVASKAGWTPFAGREVRGTVVATFLRGTELVRDGALRAGAPEGRFIPGAGSVSRGPGA